MLARALWLGFALSACTSARPVPRTEPAPDAGTPRAQPPPPLELVVDRARLERDVASFAKPRPPRSPAHRRLQRTLAERLAELGFDVERHAYGSGTNLIGRLGSARESVVVSAHYDHVPKCAGADDNASGVAAVLEIARLLAPQSFEHALVVAFWDEEELGLIGSRAYANRARDRGEPIRVAFSLDAVGYASDEPGSQRVPEGFEAALPEHAALLDDRGRKGDFIAVLANTDASFAVAALSRHARSSGLPLLSLELSLLQALAFPHVFRSDHASFWQNGYPAVLLSDTGNFRNPGYHCLERADRPAMLNHEFLERVTRATALTVAELLRPVP